MSSSSTNVSKTASSGTRRLPGLRVGRVAGIEVHLDLSLLIIFVLIGTSLALGTFPAWHPEWGPALTWTVAACAAVCFLLSVLLHELSHAVVGRALGVPVDGITLFLFGGVASMGKEADSPRSEFLMTIVGPVTSLTIGFVGVFGASLLAPAVAGVEDPEAFAKSLGPVATILAWLGPVNVMLAIFNMVPGFPLDGGRVLRSLIWWRTGDRLKATRWAAGIGQLFGFVLIGFGILNLLGAALPRFSGGSVGGLWLILIGWFLSNAAKSSYAQLAQRSALEGLSTRQLYRQDVQPLDADMTLDAFVNGPALRSEQTSFPVQDQGGKLVGLVQARAVSEVSRDEWSSTSLREIMQPMSIEEALEVDDDATTALDRLTRASVDALPVRNRENQIVGSILQRDIARWLWLSQGEETAQR